MEVEIWSFDKESKGLLELREDIFNVEEKRWILHQVVRYQLDKRRAGTHLVKGRSDVSKSGRKIIKQKGTGSARHGASSAPQFRGGGVVFGPCLRDHGYKINKKVRALALKIALSLKLRNGELLVIDNIAVPTAKTKEVNLKLRSFSQGKILLVDSVIDNKLALATKNLHKVNILPVAGLNVYDILRCEMLCLSQDAVRSIEERLKS